MIVLGVMAIIALILTRILPKSADIEATQTAIFYDIVLKSQGG
jgi:hypothetical protein